MLFRSLAAPGLLLAEAERENQELFGEQQPGSRQGG